METDGRTSDSLRGLVQELDELLVDPAPPAIDDIEIIDDAEPDISERRFPAWLGFLLVTALVGGASFAIVRPWQNHCGYSQEICEIAELDIDAIRITVPDSQLIASLPDIDSLDPNDVLTAGEIWAMERFAHLDVEQLLSDDEVRELLGTAG